MMNLTTFVNHYPKKLFLLFLAVISLTACKNNAEKNAEDLIENAYEKETGQKMDVNLGEQSTTIKTDMGTTQYSSEIKSWPKDIPSDVPEFAFGKLNGGLTTDQNDGHGWTLNYINVPKEAVREYEESLKSNGFQTNVVIINDQGGSVMGTKGKISVTFMGGEEGGVLSVFVGKE
ncbi:MAG TPA: hypothetical protein PLU49_07200 [Saprospiraceae bacterium]|nr:hypothetical protein [Saprospiraceae bacterium]